MNTHPTITLTTADTAAALAAAIQPQTVTTDELQAMSAEQLCVKALELNRYLTRNNFTPAAWRAPLDYKTKQLERVRKSELIRLTTIAQARGIELPKFTHEMGCMSEPEWKAFMTERGGTDLICDGCGKHITDPRDVTQADHNRMICNNCWGEGNDPDEYEQATFNAARAEAVTSGEKRVAMIQRGMPQ